MSSWATVMVSLCWEKGRPAKSVLVLEAQGHAAGKLGISTAVFCPVLWAPCGGLGTLT